MSYDPSNPLYNIAVPSPRNKVKRATAKFIADRPKATTEKALEGYDYLRSNSNKLEYNNSMKVKPIKADYIYFFADAELYQLNPYKLIGGPEKMANLHLGTWERVNVATGGYITALGVEGATDPLGWYQVNEEFSKNNVYDTYPVLIGPTKQIFSRIYEKDEKFI